VSVALSPAGEIGAAPPATDAAPYPSAVLGWWALAVFTIALVVAYADRQVLNLLVDPVRADLHISDTQISLLQGAAFALFYATAGVPLGRAADIFPRRAVIVAGVLGWSVSAFACGLAATYGELFLARLCVGFGEAALLPAALSILSDYFPPTRRGTAIGVIIVGAATGNAVATLIGGFMYGAVKAGAFNWVPGIAGVHAWRAVFFLISAPGALVALLVMTVREPVRRAVAGGADRASLREALAEFRARAGALVPIYASLALMGVSSFTMIAWAPALLSRRYGLNPSEIAAQLGLIAMVGGVTGSLGMAVLGDAVTRRWGKPARLAVAAVVALTAAIGAGVGLASSALQVSLLAGASTFGAAGSMAIASASIQDVVSGRIRGVSAALVSLAAVLVGMSFGPTLVALVTDAVYHDPAALGWSITTIGVPAAIAGAATLWWAQVSLRRKPELAADSGY